MLVEQLRECRDAMGSPIKFRTQEEENTAIALRRSSVAARNINQGEELTKMPFHNAPRKWAKAIYAISIFRKENIASNKKVWLYLLKIFCRSKKFNRYKRSESKNFCVLERVLSVKDMRNLISIGVSSKTLLVLIPEKIEKEVIQMGIKTVFERFDEGF